MSERLVKSVPAREELVYFGSDISILGYLVEETEEIRYSKAGIAMLLGYTKDWFNGLDKRGGKRPEALLAKGYTGWTEKLKVLRPNKRGATIAETLSGDDFDILVETEAQRGNPRAIALLSASWKQYRVDQSRHAFGFKERSQQEKLTDFQETYDAYLANQEDWQVIEEQEQFLMSRADAITGSWREEEFYIPTAAGYEQDPDCYHPRLTPSESF